MANAQWPDSLPKITSDTFAYAPLVDNVIESSVETGAPKRRRRFTYVPETLTGTLLLTGAQCATLRDFVATTLQDVLPFDWIDLRDRSAASYIFQKRPGYKQVVSGVDFWQVSLELVMQ